MVKLTKEEIDISKYQAGKTIMELLGENAISCIVEVFSDLDALIASKIERAVMEVRKMNLHQQIFTNNPIYQED